MSEDFVAVLILGFILVLLLVIFLLEKINSKQVARLALLNKLEKHYHDTRVMLTPTELRVWEKGGQPRYWKREKLPIHGPSEFTEAVNRLLDELRTYAPARYQEAVEYLAKAEYVPRGENTDYAGRSDGYFTIDGSDYPYFRFVFLHEVGHCVEISQHNNRSEEAANRYAHQVLRELGI